jgi:hypothetical protein
MAADGGVGVLAEVGIGIGAVQRDREARSWQHGRRDFHAAALRLAAVRIDAESVHDLEQLDVFPVEEERGDIERELAVCRAGPEAELIARQLVRLRRWQARPILEAARSGPPGRNPVATRR